MDPEDDNQECTTTEPANSKKEVFIPPRGLSTAAYLEDLTLRLAQEYSKNPDLANSPLSRLHLHPNLATVRQPPDEGVVAQLASGSNKPASTSDQYAGRQRDIEVYNITAAVHRGTRRAEVYFMARERNPVGSELLSREVVNVMRWERRLDDGLWQVVRHSVLRGGGGMWAGL